MRTTTYSSVIHKLLTTMVVAAMVMVALPIRPAYAASLTVNTTTDEFTSVGTQCSLREAIVLANNNGTSANDCTRTDIGDDDIITLQSGSTYTLSLAGAGGATIGDLNIGNAAGTSGNLTIQASSSTPAIIDANDIDRVLNVDAMGNYSLTLINIIVTNGNTTGQSITTGGGIRFSGTGTLTLINSAVTSSVATNTAGCGGGIYNNSAATVILTDSTIDGNTCADGGADGGGLFKGIGGTVTISNSTFSNNSAGDNGGGAHFGAGTVTIANSTFANNTAGTKGGAIQVGGATVSVEFSTFSANAANDVVSGTGGGAVQANSGSASISTSILANSSAGLDCDKSSTGTVTLTNSLAEEKGDCSGTPTSTADPGLGPLMSNGGNTETMAIGDTSAAYNSATSCGLFTTDQRGLARPQDGFCDLGAYELQNSISPTVVSVVRASSDPTTASNVNYTVTFSKSVSGVDTTDFSVTSTDTANGAVNTVSAGPSATYTVNVNNVSGNGTIRLDVLDDDTIIDINSNTLDGGFTNGEVYTIDNLAPTVFSITRADANPTSAANVDFGVAFSEAVTGVTTDDFTVTTTSGAISGASVTSVNGLGETYTVTVNTGSGDGTIRLDLNASGTGITDLANNNVSGGFTTGEEYNVDKTFSTTLNSIGAHDGWILESSETSSTGGTKNNTETTFNLGDNAARNQYRSILSFNTSSLPDNAIITKVTLKVKKHSIVGGGNPVSLFQGFRVDIKTGLFGTGALELGDFKAAASRTLGPFSPTLSGGRYSLNLTNGKANINKVGHTQLRLRFSLDDNNNSIANILKLFSGNATVVSDRPQLIIEYTLP